MLHRLEEITRLQQKIEKLQKKINGVQGNEQEVKINSKLWSSVEIDQDQASGAEFHNSGISFGISVIVKNISKNYTGQINEIKLIIHGISGFVSCWNPKEENFLDGLFKYYS